MVTSLGSGFLFKGIATPSSPSGTGTYEPDQNVFYLATTAGTYTYLGGLVVAAGEVAFLCFDGTWTKKSSALLSTGGIVDNLTTSDATKPLSAKQGKVLKDAQDTQEAELTALGQEVGELDDLTTTDKTSIVAAINEAASTGGGATLTGYVSVASVADLPDPGQPTLGYLIGTNLYLYVETGGDTLSGKYKNCGPFRGPVGPAGATGATGATGAPGEQGPAGVTSVVVSVDDTSGAPEATANLIGQQLHLSFVGLKGEQGNTGSSVSYPYELINNLTTDDATKGLTAAMGKKLEDEINGVPHEVIAAWGNWQLSPSNPARAFCICASNAILNGVLVVKLSSYTTYKIGVCIQNGTAWTSAVITDTGWKTTDIQKTISAAEAGYNIRVTIARVDNAPINTTEFLSVLSELKFSYYDATSGVSARVSTLESSVAELSETLSSTESDLSNLQSVVLGDTGTQSGEFGAWQNAVTNPPRIFSINAKKTAEGGVISIKFSSYSTYKFGLTIQTSTAYSSTTVYDSGWKTSDLTKTISASEADLFIRVAVARNDNGDITIADVEAAITELSYTYEGESGGLDKRVEELEEANSNRPRRIPMEVLGTFVYAGQKIDVSEHLYSVVSLGSFSSGPGSSLQGFAVYGDYLFQCFNTNNAFVIYKLSTQTQIQMLTLQANVNNHANSATFGKQKYNNSDPFPCLYVSSEGEKKVYVYRITGTEGAFSASVVQVITFDVPYYFPNMHIDAPNHRGVVVGYYANSWQNPSSNRMLCCCFDLPDVTAGDKTLSQSYWEFSFPFLYAAQGAVARYGKLYAAFGNTAEGIEIGGVVVIDYILKNVESFIDLKAAGNFEPEGVGLWDDGLVITTQTGEIKILTF